MDIRIYHNPGCGTSRNVLAMIRNTGIEPEVIEYLKTPPGREELADMIARAGLTAREAVREKGTPYAELGLDDPALTDEQLLDAMQAKVDGAMANIARFVRGEALQDEIDLGAAG